MSQSGSSNGSMATTVPRYIEVMSFANEGENEGEDEEGEVQEHHADAEKTAAVCEDEIQAIYQQLKEAMEGVERLMGRFSLK